MKITNLITSIATTISCLAISQLTAFAADEEGGKEEGAKRKVVIGFIAKSLANDVFQVAQAGAKDAAKELGAKYNVDVEVEIRTPNDEDATKQVTFGYPHSQIVSQVTRDRLPEQLISGRC